MHTHSHDHNLYLKPIKINNLDELIVIIFYIISAEDKSSSGDFYRNYIKTSEWWDLYQVVNYQHSTLLTALYMQSKRCGEQRQISKKLKWKRLTFLYWAGISSHGQASKNIYNVETFLKVPIFPTWVKLNVQNLYCIHKNYKKCS